MSSSSHATASKTHGIEVGKSREDAARAKRGQSQRHKLYPLPGELYLTPDIQLDKLVTSQLGFLAQRRLARGVRLNHVEACVRTNVLPRPAGGDIAMADHS